MANTLPGTPYVESSDLVANYPAVSESLAERVDLVGILPFATSTARGTALPTPTDGQFSYLQDSNSTEFWNGSAWEIIGGKILQVVRATDTTDRSTTSATYVDANISVTITPKKSTSAVLLIHAANMQVTRNATTGNASIRITDSSNNAISGAESPDYGFLRVAQSGAPSATGIFFPLFLAAYATPATTSAVTYKVRFLSPNGATVTLTNSVATGQMYAIEVGA